MVDEPAGLLLEQRAVGVDIDRLLVLHRLVAPFAESRRVIEVSCRHRLGAQQEGLVVCVCVCSGRSKVIDKIKNTIMCLE